MGVRLGKQFQRSPEDLAAAVRDEALPWLDGTRDRAALASWAGSDPDRIWPPAERPRYAKLFVHWGLWDASASVLADLDGKWRSLAAPPDTVEARRLFSDLPAPGPVSRCKPRGKA